MNRNAEKLNSFSSGLIGLAVRVLVAAGLILVLARGMAVAYRFGYSAFYEQGKDAPPGKNIYVTIPEGMDLWEASELLLKRGVADNVWALRLQALFFDLEVQPGRYQLNSSETAEELLRQLDAGPETAEETDKK